MTNPSRYRLRNRLVTRYTTGKSPVSRAREPIPSFSCLLDLPRLVPRAGRKAASNPDLRFRLAVTVALLFAIAATWFAVETLT